MHVHVLLTYCFFFLARLSVAVAKTPLVRLRLQILHRNGVKAPGRTLCAFSSVLTRLAQFISEPGWISVLLGVVYRAA